MCTAATYYSKDHYFGRNLDFYNLYEETDFIKCME